MIALYGCSDNPGRSGPGGGTTSKGGGADLSIPGTSTGCAGLGCFQMSCANGGTTTVSGKVTAPNGLDPVYNALVYVPTQIPEFPMTAQCEVCNDPIGGAPVVSATTAVDGTFTLSNVPVTQQVPIVVQKGRFRRINYLTINGCVDNPLTADQARLPKNAQEGDLPRMAVGTGDYDQIECVLRSIGIDNSEFTDPSGPGHVHLYSNWSGGTNATLESLLMDANKLQTYNLVFVNCTGTSITQYASPATVETNLFNYVNTGGRLYVTDWSYDYMEQVTQFAPYIFFDGGGDMTNPQPANAAYWIWDGSPLPSQVSDPTLAQWLKATNASPDGSVTINGSWALALSTAQNQMMYPSTTWVHGSAKSVDRPETVTFDYNMCGKVLWSSYHTQEPGQGGASDPTFPNYCQSTPSTMQPQEKILEYLIFEISSCVAPVG